MVRRRKNRRKEELSLKERLGVPDVEGRDTALASPDGAATASVDGPAPASAVREQPQTDRFGGMRDDVIIEHEHGAVSGLDDNPVDVLDDWFADEEPMHAAVVKRLATDAHDAPEGASGGVHLEPGAAAPTTDNPVLDQVAHVRGAEDEQALGSAARAMDEFDVPAAGDRVGADATDAGEAGDGTAEFSFFSSRDLESDVQEVVLPLREPDLEAAPAVPETVPAGHVPGTPAPEPEVEPQPVVHPDPDPQPVTDPLPETDPDPKVPEVEPEPVRHPEPDPQPDPDPQPLPATDPEPVMPETDPETDPDPVPTPMAAATQAWRERATGTAARIAPQASRTAARTANSARRTWIAVVFFPIFAAYLAVDAVRDLVDKVRRDQHEQREATPPFRRPSSMPTGSDRTMEEIVATVESFPFDPLPMPTQVAFFRDFGPDATGALFSSDPQMTTIPHFYPHSFRQCLLPGAGGERLAGMQAMHEHRGPALIICHGMLMTKNFDAIIQLARRAYEDWGFHVVTFDLRGWGQSAWTTAAPASGGFWEGRDVLEIARMLKQHELVTSVGAVGFSLGGSTVMQAAHVASQAGEDSPLDGGIVSVSAPSRIDVALEHISKRPDWRDPYFGLWQVFRAAIKGNVKRRRLSRDIRTWKDMTEATAIPYYGITMDEWCSQASAANFAGGIELPTLHLHAADDFLIPIEHAWWLRDAAEGNPNVHVLTRDVGNHCSFTAVDPRWFHSVVRRWFEYWATPA